MLYLLYIYTQSILYLNLFFRLFIFKNFDRLRNKSNWKKLKSSTQVTWLLTSGVVFTMWEDIHKHVHGLYRQFFIVIPNYMIYKLNDAFWMILSFNKVCQAYSCLCSVVILTESKQQRIYVDITNVNEESDINFLQAINCLKVQCLLFWSKSYYCVSFF